MSYTFTVTEPNITTPYEIESEKWSVGSGKAEATDVWIVKPYENCVALINSITRKVSGTGSSITIRLPLKHSRVNARLVKVSCDGMGPIKDASNPAFRQYTQARLTLSYSSETQTNTGTAGSDGKVIIEENIRPNTRFLTIPGRTLYWNNDQTSPLKNDEAPGMQIRMTDWEYTIMDFPYVPNAALIYPGYVNSATVTSSQLGYTFPAGTLLFGDPDCSRTITSEGVGGWRIRYTFTFFAQGWNKFPRAGYDTFQPIYDYNGLQFYPYPSVDFNGFLF